MTRLSAAWRLFGAMLKADQEGMAMDRIHEVPLAEQEEGLLNRLAYAVGVALIAVGAITPHGTHWTVCGVALVAFGYVF
ncbi:hypothetical protein [Silvibacterium sp.]|uniref:hypothetical protein n=1 Tax=Silvibacterium sp. TaxID=1964179 RepID=UPI0039E326E7